MFKRLLIQLSVAAATLAIAPAAFAAGGNYSFDGGSQAEQTQVTAALNASSFPWGVVPGPVVVHIQRDVASAAAPNQIWLDANLLDSGRFSWGVVQHEMGHQVDFFLFDDTKRAQLDTALGGQNWCYSVQGLAHSAYGCERFASELAWAYWPSADNSMKPGPGNTEAGAMPVVAFRALLAQMLGVPSVAAAPPVLTKAFAPTTVRAPASAKTAAKPKTLAKHTSKP
jgi:hypothetical protein